MRLMTAVEAKQLLAQYGVPVATETVARSADEAVAAARLCGGAVVMKIVSPDISHKSDAGCVLLNLQTEAEIRSGYQQILAAAQAYNAAAVIEGVSVEPFLKIDREVIVGVTRDSQFGPVVLFGLGGIYTELFEDVALRLLPVDRAEAEAMIRETKTFRLLQGMRGRPPVDLDAVVNVILSLSRLVADTGDRIVELDINPLVCSPQGVLAVDARIAVKE